MARSNHPTVCWKTTSIDVPASVLPADSNLKCNKLYIAFNPSNQSDKWVCSTNLYEATGHTQACANYNAKHDGERLNIKTLVYSARARRKHTDTKHLNYMPLYEACSEAERFHCNEFAAWLRQAVIDTQQPVEPDDLFSEDTKENTFSHSDLLPVFDLIHHDDALFGCLVDSGAVCDQLQELIEYLIITGDKGPLAHCMACMLKQDNTLFSWVGSELKPSAIAATILDVIEIEGVFMPAVKHGCEQVARDFLKQYFIQL